MNKLKIFTNGIIKENPSFVLLLGMCPLLAVTTSVNNAIGMGLAATAVLIGSNFVVSCMRKIIPDKIRIASYIVIIAGFVTLVQMLVEAFVPALYDALGVFLPLIVVNCIILARAESFASKNPPLASVLDGAGMGLGFTLGLTVVSTIRELLGSGSFYGLKLFGDGFQGATVMILPPGGFLSLGIIIAVINLYRIHKKRKAVMRMSFLHRILMISLTAILVENFVLVKFMGICPFLGVSKKLKTSIGMGGAVTFVMGLSSAITWLVQEYLLNPFGLEYLQTIAFILVIAALVQFVEMALMKLSPPLYDALGIYLPLITTNCAVLGVTILNQQKGFGFVDSIVNGVAAALGFTMALLLFAGVRERLENSDIPEFMQGFSIALISASLISLAFFGFQGFKFM